MQQNTAQSSGGKKRKSLWSRSTKQILADVSFGPMPAPPPRPDADLSTPSRFHTLKSCPLSVFRECLLSQDWSKLVTAGNPPKEAIDAAGFELYSDYCAKIGGPQMANLIERSRSIQALAFRLERVSRIVAAAKLVHDARLIEEFRAEGFRAEAKQMETADDATYLRILGRVESLMKQDELKLERLAKEQPKQAKTLTPEAVDQDFEDTIIAIAEVLQIKVDEEKESVYRYCGYVLRLRAKIESLNRTAAAGGKKH